MAPGGVDALEMIGTTYDPRWSAAGFVEKWVGYLTEFGEWWSAFKDPTTGQWGGFKYSSRNEL